MKTVELVPWSPSWRPDFEVLAARIVSAGGTRVLRVDHIGSTSVSGLAAKDCVDVQVIVGHLPDEALTASLLAAGFIPSPGAHEHRDHVPESWQGDPSAWDKRVFRPPANSRTGNIHVRVSGQPNERYALLFRDFLRANPATSASWSLFKTRLAAAVADLSSYGRVKDPATDVLMAAAERWAADTSWSVPTA